MGEHRRGSRMNIKIDEEYQDNVCINSGVYQ